MTLTVSLTVRQLSPPPTTTTTTVPPAQHSEQSSSLLWPPAAVTTPTTSTTTTTPQCQAPYSSGQQHHCPLITKGLVTGVGGDDGGQTEAPGVAWALCQPVDHL